ncbi:hypothetical protein DERF_005094 [Dermatophagoides farinae]|uniref:Uncharacterized protein n=1 Tax=Dermatophagoides farinae TaxID=6954 RepID=A0A922I8N8_DERFA|nr:hypothetical protein DERF_005094 [Dermatophagoides farinae]
MSVRIFFRRMKNVWLQKILFIVGRNRNDSPIQINSCIEWYKGDGNSNDDDVCDVCEIK